MTDCHCHRCTKERVEADAETPRMFGQPTAMMVMFLCATCGNKRCPCAADHRLTCSGSNAPGQAGSLYENVPVFEPVADTTEPRVSPGIDPK